MKKRIVAFVVALVIVIGMLPTVAFAANTTEFAGGSGTQADPYLIETKEHLNNIRFYLSAHFKLISDIEFTDADFAEGGAFYNNGCGWAPLGDDFENPFYGEFDGNDHLISNLNCSSNKQWSGLFGYNLGEIKNLVISQCNISSSSNYHPFIGGIVGVNEGDIYNCKTLDSVIINDNTNVLYCVVGGICGENHGTISNCITSGQVSGITAGGICGFSQGTINNCVNRASIYFDYQTEFQEFSCEIGGIVGYNGGIVTQCKNNGNISANLNAPNNSNEIWFAASAGGIIGRNETEGTISECHNNGSVSSKSITLAYTGGIVAFNRCSKVENCYNSGTIASNDLAGGIIGFNEGGTISNCYNVGKNDTAVLSATYVGGICGKSYYSNIFDCYYLNDIQLGIGIGDELVDSSSNLELREQKTFKNFDFNSVWEFTEGNAYLYPTLQNIEHFVIDEGSDFNGGNGTEQSPYLIASTKQLDNVRKNLSAHYKLVKNIEFTDVDFAEGGDFYNDGKGFTPFGTYDDNPFTGVFNGNGFVVENLYINTSSSSIKTTSSWDAVCGFFIYNKGEIKNFGIINSDITFTSTSSSLDTDIGGIVGYNKGTITNCYNTGSVSNRYGCAGGIVGYNGGTITNCYNTGSVSNRGSSTGGIVGTNHGTITNCYNIGEMIYESDNFEFFYKLGGIAGYNSGMIKSCYNIGKLSVPVYSYAEVGGIVGYNHFGTITNCYNVSAISGYLAGGIAGDNYNEISNCYNIGLISGDRAGGIVGEKGGTITNCYYLDTILKDVGNGIDTSIKCTSHELKLHYTYIGFDFESVWTMDGSSCYPYPELKNIDFVTKHIYENACDTTCDCGYVRIITHDHKPIFDDDNHFDKCTVCGNVINTNAHKFDNACDTDCTCGYVRTVPGHIFDNACDTNCNICSATRTVPNHVYTNNCDTTCNVCNAVRTTKHTYDNACDTSCNVCSANRVTTHSFGEYVYDNNATETADGTKTRTCSACGHKETITADGTKLEKTLIDSSEKFKDVPATSWYKQYVDYAVTYGIFSGTSDTTFEPNKNMTRAQFVQVFANLSGVDSSNTNVNSGFSDVPKGKWYTSAVTWASNNGIVSGMGNGTFEPNTNVTREQMCVMLVNYVEKYQKNTLKTNTSAPKFDDDIDISGWAKTQVYKCANAGLVNGVGNNKFDPKASATRAQGATIFSNFYKEYMN